jgi:hypothetical protein
MTHILVGTPCRSGRVTLEYMFSMISLRAELDRQGIGLDIDTPTNEALIPRARNHVVAKLLSDRKYTHLLFVDDDISFDAAQVSRLLAANKPFTAGIYPIRRLDIDRLRQLPEGVPEGAILDYVVKLQPGQAITDGLALADHVGGGFMLLRREVLESMAAHHPELLYSHAFAPVAKGDEQRVLHFFALFDASLRDGAYLPEDYTFCRRWRDIGGEIWADITSKLVHVDAGRRYHGDYLAFLEYNKMIQKS